eukprot:2787014-Prorocentrum_lima.AAC.1
MASKRHECTCMPSWRTCDLGPPLGRKALDSGQNGCHLHGRHRGRLWEPERLRLGWIGWPSFLE